MSAEPAARPVEGLSPYWVFTAAGIPFDFENPRPEMIDTRALLWQLSGEGRWSNNTHWPLSVLQHSYSVATGIPNPAWRIYGLLHDAAEAFTRDLATPFKLWCLAQGADVVALERRILTEAVLPHFQLPPMTAEIAAAVDEADARALASEYRDVVMGKGEQWVPKAKPFAAPVIFQQRDKVLDRVDRELPSMIRDAHRAGLRRAA
jgi:hypothetical protein